MGILSLRQVLKPDVSNKPSMSLMYSGSGLKPLVAHLQLLQVIWSFYQIAYIPTHPEGAWSLTLAVLITLLSTC